MLPLLFEAPQCVTQRRVLRAEWTKLRTQPATAWATIITGVLIVGVGIVYSLLRVARPPHGADLSGCDAPGVPSRLPLLWAKVTISGVVTTVMSMPFAFVAFFAGQSILARQHLDTAIGAPGALRAVIGSALYLGVTCLSGLGFGVLLRNSAGAIGALLGTLFGLPILAGFVPGSLSETVNKYLPATAGQQVTMAHADPSMLSPWAGFGLMMLYAAVVLALAAMRMRNRDA